MFRLLARLDRWRSWRRCLLAFLGLTAGLISLGLAVIHFVPLPAELFEPIPPQREVLDRNGQSLRTVRSADGRFSRQVPLTEIPPALIHATLAAEDKRFWKHPGMDWRACFRSGWQLLRYRRIISGGSTITQQLIKMSHPRPRTFRVKLLEIIQALRLEQIWGKQRILFEYLNRLDYGNLNTGCAAAALFYFGKPVQQLSAAECAMLAGLPQAPTRLNPILHGDKAKRRQQWVLRQMLVNNMLTEAEYRRAAAEQVNPKQRYRSFLAPHFVDLLLQHAGPIDLPRNTAALRTTLDLNFCRQVEEIVAGHARLLSRSQPVNAACVVIDNRTGGVLALVGSENYFATGSGQVNGAWAARSAGSTFKPFTYLLALERGATPATIVADVPTEFSTSTGVFAPVNYDRHTYGPTTYRLALANSLNISAVKVLESIGGPAPLIDRLRECGLSTLTESAEHYGLGLTIGNAEARLLELADAYASLARLGVYRPFTLLARHSDLPSPRQATEKRVFEADHCYLLADILADNSARAQAFGIRSALRFRFPVACKTGTSTDFRDNWAFGYTPEYTVGVWVGRFDGAPMEGVSGVTGAAPILQDVMNRLHDQFGTSWYARPERVIELPVHRVTGKRLPLNSLNNGMCALEKFVAAQIPPAASPSDFNTQGQILLGGEYQQWLASGDNWLGDLATIKKASVAQVVYPVAGTRFFLDPDLPMSGGRIRPKCNGVAKPVWSSPTLRCEEQEGVAVVFLQPGTHRLELMDAATGSRSQTWFEVSRR